MANESRCCSRRELIRRGSRLAGAALGLGLSGAAVRALAAEIAAGAPDPSAGFRAAGILPSYIVDAQGNRSVKKGDENLVRRALRSRRGWDVVARDGYDYRADVLGRGRVDNKELNAVKAAIAYYREHPEEILPRPITVTWHYSWYHPATRKAGDEHVWFVGGGYSSRVPEDEAKFNDLKNEFGITVDAISWDSTAPDGKFNRNTELGYFAAGNAKTRRAALLYETLLSLGIDEGVRIDFEIAEIRDQLVRDFRGMARTLKKLRDDSKARVFTIDGKPVIFLYASHMWGVNTGGDGPQYDHIDDTMANARNAFRKIYGSEPFVVGEEMTLGVNDSFDAGRRRRSGNFDGVFAYHHAASHQFITDGGRTLRGRYVDQVKAVLKRTYEGAMGHKSRFTGKPMLVVPSLAAGFSKVRVPTLFCNRADYAKFLKQMLQYHRDEYLIPAFGPEAHRTFAPLVTVGAWNEEWEGHSVFPAKFNRSLSPRVARGFDYVMGIKQAVGWNHYAKRSLPPVVP